MSQGPPAVNMMGLYVHHSHTPESQTQSVQSQSCMEQTPVTQPWFLIFCLGLSSQNQHTHKQP